MFSGFKSGGVLQGPVGEDSFFVNKNKLVIPEDSPPASAGGQCEHEYHGEAARPRAASLSRVMPQVDRRAGTPDEVERPQVAHLRCRDYEGVP